MSEIKPPALGPLDLTGQLDVARLHSGLNNLSKIKSSAPAHEKEIEKAATQFEAMLVHEMIKSMWSSIPKDGLISGSREEELFQDMFQEQVANSIAEHQSIGVKNVIISDIKRTEERNK